MAVWSLSLCCDVKFCLNLHHAYGIRVVRRLSRSVGSSFFFIFQWVGLWKVDCARGTIFMSIVFKWPIVVQVHDILTVMHEITHWSSAYTHSRYCRIYFPELDVTGNSVGWGPKFSLWVELGDSVGGLSWVGSWKMDTWTTVHRMHVQPHWTYGIVKYHCNCNFTFHRMTYHVAKYTGWPS